MNITIDSNSLTYLIQASEPDYDPSDDEKSNYLEKISMLRIFLYGGLRCGILPHVIKEIHDISETKWKELHQSTSGVLFHEIEISNSETEIDKRKMKLLETHHKEKDCRLLAEAEFSKIDVLLTRDHRFRNRLNDISKVEIVFPSDFVKTMNLKEGAVLIFTPHKTNPLSQKSWWKL